MKAIWNSAIGLLLVSGALLGLALPLGKLAGGSGVHPAVWALVISAGGGGVLFAALLARGDRLAIDAHRLRYYFTTAAVTYAIPNLLLFSVMPHVGAGYGGIMYTLSPVMTLSLSLLTGLARPSGLGIAGIAVGFVGAVLVAATRGEAGEPAALVWVALGMLIPLSLALGNIYRSYDWPEGAGPLELAAGSNLAAGLLLLAFLGVTGDIAAVADLGRVPWLFLTQVAASAAMFVFF
ncbi:MAG: EamA family transporter, partial [Rhizobiaceae bacterium]|nr:EamA family transporter [Rhizobiaceae bacterium]